MKLLSLLLLGFIFVLIPLLMLDGFVLPSLVDMQYSYQHAEALAETTPR